MGRSISEDLDNIDTEEKVQINICGFDNIRRCIYFGKEPDQVEVSVKSVKNVKTTLKDKITGEIIKSVSELVVEWVWKLRKSAFESTEGI